MVAEFRFYEELNDFLPQVRRKCSFTYAFAGTPAVKDVIEAIGVPHTEVDLILVDGQSVDFAHRLCGGERVAVYPVFERLDIAPLTRLRPRPLREPRFLLDAHLGRLARYLRLLGFDARWGPDCADATLVRDSLAERRIVLTRDKGLLKHGALTHGYWIRSTGPRDQLREVVHAFDLGAAARPFTRCMVCNGELAAVTRDMVADRIPARVRERFDAFRHCAGCGRVFWAGSHHERMRRLVDDVCSAGNGFGKVALPGPA